MRSTLTTGAVFAAFACLGAPTAAQTDGATSPVVFKRDADYCYRIPALATVGETFVAVAERREGFRGRRPCSDDGDVDLVLKTSADGKQWSSAKVLVDNDAVSAAIEDPKSPGHDPEFAKVDKADRYMRVGAPGLASTQGKLILVFTARYNLANDCGDRFGCANSPENLKRTLAREQKFVTVSDDVGKTWSAPRSIQAEVGRACLNRFFGGQEKIRNALSPMFAEHATTSSSAASAKERLVGTMSDMRRRIRGDNADDADIGRIARDLGVGDVARQDLSKLALLLNPRAGVGPGTATVFPYNGSVRIFVPGLTLAFYSDDLGKTWSCSDTSAIVKGSERQAAWLGGGDLVMTLRQTGNRRAREYRLFATSSDGGATWSADAEVSAGGRPLLPDAVVQGSIAGFPDAKPPFAVLANIANQRGASDDARGDADAGDDEPRRRRGARRERAEKQDPRRNLALTRVFLNASKVSPAFRSTCDRTTGPQPDSLTIWPGSAAYSSIIALPKKDAVAILFEASDDDGAETAKRAWTESIRFMETPLSRIGAGEEPPVCK